MTTTNDMKLNNGLTSFATFSSHDAKLLDKHFTMENYQAFEFSSCAAPSIQALAYRLTTAKSVALAQMYVNQADYDEDFGHEDTIDVKDRMIVSAGCVPFEFQDETCWLYVKRSTEKRGPNFNTVLFLPLPKDSAAKLLHAVVAAAFKCFKREPVDEKHFILYRWKFSYSYGEWEDAGPAQQAGKLTDVVLPKDLLETITKDVSEFWKPETKTWYERFGIPFRRSLLLYGPPGTGKTSLIKALAARHNKKVCFLQTSHADFDDSTMSNAMSKLPENAILVLEDVDAQLTEDQSDYRPNRLSLSGILNALDGIVSPATKNGQLVILTSNNPEKLVAVAARSGRIDSRYLIPMPDQDQLRRLFLKFYPPGECECDTKLLSTYADGFAARLLECADEISEALSMAAAQRFFIVNRQMPPSQTLAALEVFLDEERITKEAMKAKPSTTEEKDNSSGSDLDSDDDDDDNDDDDDDSNAGGGKNKVPIAVKISLAFGQQEISLCVITVVCLGLMTVAALR